MGYAANGWCFDDAASAAAYACGHGYPLSSVVVDGTGQPAVLVVECTGTSDNVLTLARSVNGQVVATSTLSLSPPACDALEWHTYYPFSWSASDGALLGAAVAGVWLLAWGFRAAAAALGGRVVAGGADAED